MKKTNAQITILIIIAIISITLFLQSSYFNVSKITVKGTTYFNVNNAMQIADVQPGINIFKVNSQKISDKLKMNQWVKDASVKRVLPSTLNIIIEEHEVSAIAIIGSQYVAVNSEGLVLQNIDDLASIVLPIITGIQEAEELNYGQKIESENLSNGLKVIAMFPEDYNHLISEVNVENKSNIYLFLTNGMQIRLGTIDDIERKMGQISEVLISIDTTVFGSVTLDLRFDGLPIINYND